MRKTHTHHTGQSHAHTYTSLNTDARAYTQSVIPSATFLLEFLSTGNVFRLVVQNNQTDFSLSLSLSHTHTHAHINLVPPPWTADLV